ncbi:MAG: thiamine-phosphate kinase [Dongiaceae bacterium]
MPGEFSLIETYFKPLALLPESLGLKDDAALMSIPPGQELVVTTDAIISGIDFLGNEKPHLIAQKALRVNLSDLAAMGAKPYAYTLVIAASKEVDADFWQGISLGLAEDQKHFGIGLIGGDLSRTPGPLSLTITAFGLVPKGRALRRGTAKAGDSLFVSGTIGDSYLGLQSFKGRGGGDEYFRNRYLLPEPRVTLGEKLRELATSAIDISDGLLADANHLAGGVEIELSAVPFSISGQDEPALLKLMSAGDDYELLFTTSLEKEADIKALSSHLDLKLTKIGRILNQGGVKVRAKDGGYLPLPELGHDHFA